MVESFHWKQVHEDVGAHDNSDNHIKDFAKQRYNTPYACNVI